MPRRHAIVEYTDSEIIVRIPYRVTMNAGEATCTARELEVLPLVQQGLANKEIAGKLHMAERTVKLHVSALLKKFNVTERHQL